MIIKNRSESEELRVLKALNSRMDLAERKNNIFPIYRKGLKVR